MTTFTVESFPKICTELALIDADLGLIIDQYGIPPMFSRPATFESLVHIIIEQQVSLASAKAVSNKLLALLGTITPEKILAHNEEALKSCSLSRQKITYIRHLAEAVEGGKLEIKNLSNLSIDVARNHLKQVKGIGDWSAEVFLMMAIHYTDCFPIGDVALINGVKALKNLPKETTKEQIASIALSWQPYRTIAAYLIWWYYIKKKKISHALLQIG